ncbi:hypothetical protein [Candidatus Accumulibacter sp. ACC012]|uniref:hypothetical protein n=1 Tax=Candidatus Accumulibacter sp. ACC012 TaxID=2823332 RepID=UPI0025C47CA7|nr:hypothetical protein [Candidatus Accumulibacter sp. ACC012]
MNWLHGTIAAIAGVLGLFIAVHHPLWPNMLGVVFVAWGLAVAWRPSIFLFVLPALLPVASFSAWTGWIGIEEFDLLVLAAVSGCHAHLLVVKAARTSHDGPGDGSEHACFRLARLGLGALAVSCAVALLRGLGDAGPSLAGWFQGYEEPLNSLRVGKSLFFALLLLPSLHRLQARSPALAASRLAAGVATGLGLVTVAIIYERSAYPGSSTFRLPIAAPPCSGRCTSVARRLTAILRWRLRLPSMPCCVRQIACAGASPRCWRWALAMLA